MSDHEPNPFNPPIKSLGFDPSDTPTPPEHQNFPSGFKPAQAPFVPPPGPAPKPMSPDQTPTMKAEKVLTFSFDFVRDGVQYRAEINQGEQSGLSATMQKFHKGEWIKSYSRMKDAILAAFALQQAIGVSTFSLMELQDSKSPGPDDDDDDDNDIEVV